MQLSEYKVQVKHQKHDAYRTAIVLAPSSYVAALWFKNHTKIDKMPIVMTKNRKRFDPRTGNRTYLRAIRLQLDQDRRGKSKKLSVKQREELKEKDEIEQGKAIDLFQYCSVVEENPFVTV